MARIERIISIEKRVGRDGKPYFATLALVDGDECEGWSVGPDGYIVGEPVEKFFDDRYGKAKMRRKTLDIAE